MQLSDDFTDEELGALWAAYFFAGKDLDRLRLKNHIEGARKQAGVLTSRAEITSAQWSRAHDLFIDRLEAELLADRFLTDKHRRLIALTDQIAVDLPDL